MKPRPAITIHFNKVLTSLAVFLLTTALHAQDFPDAEQMARYQQLTKAVEVNSTIRAATTGKPGWYAIAMQGEDGKAFTVLVTPDSKFWEHYEPLENTKAYAKTVVGQKVRFMHKPAFDEALHRIWASDIMYVKDWKETLPSPPKENNANPKSGHNDGLDALRALQGLVPNRGIPLTK